jgi:hypothetical protein
VLRRLVALILPLALCGCAALISRATADLTTDLSDAILNQNDPATVRDGAPAYLLMVDGFIGRSPDDPRMLLTGAQLYGAYAAAFVEDEERAKRLSVRARDYARRALCLELEKVCEAVPRPFAEFEPTLARVRSSELPVLYGFGAAWGGWVQTHSDDWLAVAEIPKVEAVMTRVVQLDDTYADGAPHMVLGVLSTLLPASLGGKTDEARAHFERAIAVSGGRDLLFKVLYAERYARLIFDRPLHDGLLRQVLEADPEIPGLTLSNTIAQQRAQELLDGADDYF